MNKLLCFMGFFLCFSSFCMNKNANWNDEIVKIHNDNIQREAIKRNAIERVGRAVEEHRFDDACNSLRESFSNKVLNANTTFTIGELSGYVILSFSLNADAPIEKEKQYTFLSWYLSFLNDTMHCIEMECAANGLLCFLLEKSKDQLSDEYTESCYIKKNDQRIIDVVLSVINSKCFELGCCLLNGCLGEYLDPNITFIKDGARHTFLSWYLSKVKPIDANRQCFAAKFGCGLLREHKGQLIDEIKGDCWVEKYNPRLVTDVILPAINNKCLDLVWDFLDNLGKRYDNIIFKKGVKKYTLLSKDEFIESNSFAAKFGCILLEKSKDQLSDEYTESCYIKKNDPRIIDLLKYAIVNKSFEFEYYFLKSCLEHKYLIDINFLFEYQKKNYTLLSLCSACVLEDQEASYRESLSKKAVDAAKTIFSCDTRYCEKDYALIAFFSFFALEDEDASYVEKLRGDKKYFEDHVFRSVWLRDLIKNTQGSQKDSLDLLKNNTSPENLVYQNYKPLYNDIKQYEAKIRPQILREYVTCIDIIKMMRYYQE